MTKRMRMSPIKVAETTYTRVRLAASVLSKTQAEVVEAAMNEYIERHEDEIAAGLKLASESLRIGPDALAAYVAGDDRDAVRKVIRGTRPT